MKLLITGARGQLGLDLQKACRRRDIDFAASDLPELDIADLENLKKQVASENPQVIVNCAAYNAVDKAETDFETARRVNGEGPKNLAIAAEQAGIPIMHFSTDFVFDGQKGSPYTTEDKPNPISRYGESKLMGEREVQAHSSRCYLVRLSWVFGAGNVNFVKKVIEWSQGRSSLQVVDDQLSSPSYTVDLADCILDLLDTGAYGLYHLSNRGHCSRYEWARLILELARPKVKVEPVKSEAFPTPARRPEFSALDLSSIESVLGRQMPDWQDATRRFLGEIGAIK